MIDHSGIGVADIAASAAFYDAVLGALGWRRVAQMPEDKGTDGIGYGIEYPMFWIDKFHPHSTGQHTAFIAGSPAQVDAFYAAGMRAGGKDNGAPGAREKQSTPIYYAAFLRDPDGNNIEAVFRG
jgi:catechol 2,3-dioxygenase-like lactoylglutathione lyase family enzyme